MIIGILLEGLLKAPPIILPPGPPSVCPVRQRVEDGGEPVEGDGDHHETGDVETKDPNETVIKRLYG